MRYEVGFANRLGNRTANQDRFGIIETDHGVLLVLADGMGGLTQGELAAQTLVDIAREFYLEAAQPIADPARLLTLIINAAHDALARLEPSGGKARRPGTTGVLCLIQNGRAQWAHVGDSRLYVFRDNRCLFRTRDQSYVEELYEQGRITAEERVHHPRRNQITQCIGCNRQRPQIVVGDPMTLVEGDVVLLCSDGLWEYVSDELMGALLAKAGLEPATLAMAERAERAAYPRSDNISVVTLRLLSINGQRRPIPLARAEPAGSERVENAIEEIQRMIQEYEDEMNR